MKYMIKTKRCDIVRRECLVSVIFSPMISMISSITILLLEFLLLDVDPLVVVAVVASVRRFFLNSESVPISSSLRLLSLLSPSLPVSGATAGPLTPLPVPAPASPPPVPGPGPVPPPVPTSASLPPVPGPALVPPPVPVPVPVPAPVPPPVVPPGVANVHIRPALPGVAQTAAESPWQPALHSPAPLHVHQNTTTVDLLPISMLIGSWNSLGQNKIKLSICPYVCCAGIVITSETINSQHFPNLLTHIETYQVGTAGG